MSPSQAPALFLQSPSSSSGSASAVGKAAIAARDDTVGRWSRDCCSRAGRAGAWAETKPSFALAQASTVWYAQIVLIVLGHIIAVILSHLRAGAIFRTAQRALLSQYPMLLLMVLYTMTSLWILAQPTTQGG